MLPLSEYHFRIRRIWAKSKNHVLGQSLFQRLTVDASGAEPVGETMRCTGCSRRVKSHACPARYRGRH
jgi:hypothetical protein